MNTTKNLHPRMKSPVLVLPGALNALLAAGASARKGHVPERTTLLVQLRASQINGCSFCVDMHAREAKDAGETDERLFGVAAWRESPYFTEEERAALALTEAVTRLADANDAVPDELWNQVASCYDQEALAELILNIALINFWNRINVPTRQIAGSIPTGIAE